MPSLINATTTGPGTQTDFVVPRKQVRMITTVTGNAGTLVVNLEGSLDATTWLTLATSQATAGETVLSLDREIRFVRPNIAVITTAPGGTAPAVSAVVGTVGPY